MKVSGGSEDTPRVLLVSNGYGEDLMGAALARALQDRGAAVVAYPLVGLGHAYEAARVLLLDPRRTLPTAGFGFRTGPRSAWQDLRAGWLSLTMAQRRTLRAQRGRYRVVVAIGDVFCLWMASAADPGRVVYVPTAKSEYNDPHRGFELALVRRLARVSFPRDERTAQRFREVGLAADYVGNLMMDCLAFRGEDFGLPQDAPVVLLLPGSRADAAANFRRLLAAAERVVQARPEVYWLAALSPTVQVGRLAQACDAAVEGDWITRGGLRVRWTGNFADAAARATLVLGMSGTANEQAAGLGKPVVAIPGSGPQFTRKFLALQARLLGEAVVPTRDPTEAAQAVLRLLDDVGERTRRGEVGRARMGPPGAAERMADRVLAICTGR